MTYETTREAMHALLDMVVGFDEDAPFEVNERARMTATPRFAEVGAVTLLRDDEGAKPVVDAGPLIAAAGLTISALVNQIAVQKNADRLAVLATVREHLDCVFSDE